VALRKEMKALQEEQKALREEQRSLREEVKALRIDFNRMLKVIENLQRAYISLDARVRDLYNRFSYFFAAITASINQLRVFAGVSFQDFICKLMSKYLEEAGLLPKGAKLMRKNIEGYEIDYFWEDPLIIGEATAYVDSVEKMKTFVKKIEIIRKKFGREPQMKFFLGLTVKKNTREKIIEIAKREKIEVFLGRDVEG